MIKPPPDDSAPSNGGLLSDYMTTVETARELRIGHRTLLRWHALKCGPPRVKVGRQFLYRREAIRAWLEAKEQES
ncbi:helix-turn-helix domain-containing protein [Reyranella sp.]|uniref:helix-turn-helix domain-containing protein n=1 Tax=Reyranella sp. TaxID=1929291 RepID=UPI003D0DFACB